jgi:hypothetical protein
MIEYFMYGRLVEIRTIKGNNINYFNEEPWEPAVKQKYKTRNDSKHR